MTIYNVTNRETRDHTQDRHITYKLNKPLPEEWDGLTVDEKGYWLNENAEFISDYLSSVDWGDMEEETVYVAEDELQGDL
jgi:hypothetical protein